MENIATHSLQNAEFLGSRYSYQRISLLSLASEIERYYDIDVTLDGIDNKKYFSGVLILDDVDKASSYIAETLDIKYERTLQGITFFQE